MSGGRVGFGSPWAPVPAGQGRAVPGVGGISLHLPPSGEEKLYLAPAWQLSASLLLPRARRCLGTEGSGQGSDPVAPSHHHEAGERGSSLSPCSIPQAGGMSPVLPSGPPPALNPADTPRAPCFCRGFACKMRQLLRAHCGFPQQLLWLFFFSVIAGWVSWFFFLQRTDWPSGMDFFFVCVCDFC